MTIRTFSSNITWTGLFWGIIGGISLIVATQLTTNGPEQISLYPFLLIAAIVTMALSDKPGIMFGKLFKTGFLTFMIMTVILYCYIITFISPHSGINWFGHLWRIAFMIGVGALSSFLVSIIVRRIAK